MGQSTSIPRQHHPVDVTDVDAIAATVGQVVETSGRIDVLVGNAVVNVFFEPPMPVHAGWQRCMDLNPKGAWNMSRAVVPAILAQGEAWIVNIAPRARHGLVGQPRSLGDAVAMLGTHFIATPNTNPGVIGPRTGSSSVRRREFATANNAFVATDTGAQIRERVRASIHRPGIRQRTARGITVPFSSSPSVALPSPRYRPTSPPAATEPPSAKNFTNQASR